MLRQVKYKLSSSSSSKKDQNEADSDHSNISRNEVPKKSKSFLSYEGFSGKSQRRSDQSEEQFIKSPDSSGYCYSPNAKGNLSFRTSENSKHSKKGSPLEVELEDEPKVTEYISSDHDEIQSPTQPSQESTDRSKSFSQIYSEIFEESKERQQKAERACRAYNINKSKLHRSLEVSGSRGPGSGSCEGESSWGSEYSSNLERRSHEYDNLSTGYSMKKSLNSGRSSIKEMEEPKDLGLKRSKLHSHKRELRGRCCFVGNPEPRKSSFYRSENVGSEDSLKHGQGICVCARGSSVCSLCSSRARKYHSKGYNPEVTDGSDYPVDCRSDIPTTAVSQSRSQRDYLSSCSTRHRHHHHYRHQKSVPKTYQDRGNSPINIKTRRKTHDTGIGTEKVRETFLGRSSASIGLQYPSDNETEDWDGERPSSFLETELGDPNKCESHEESWLSDNEEQELKSNILLSVDNESIRTQGVSNVEDTDGNEHYRSVPTEEAVQNLSDISEYMSNEERNTVGLKEYFEGMEYDDGDSQDSNEYDENENLSDDCDHTVTSEEGISEENNSLDQAENKGFIEGDTILSNKDGTNTPSSEVAKSKRFLSLRIYDADEALMEIPKDFDGPAIVLDDDADFLDITLTDDEEQIRAKLMAAALTTRKSSSSTSLKSRRSIKPCVLSYKPSVIFTRRSEAIDEHYAPQQNDRVALLAERFLNSFSESSSNEPVWQPLAKEVTSIDPVSKTFGDREVTKKNSETPPLTDRQLLSEEFNRKLQRQLKVIVESFR
ncbi:uncharacterized protein laf [Drosophila takahashii]|uniref:uncharacterized protein laf n=1 Tax=Drosophila takahashii TaxID=29030 RepID=UPI00389906D4